MPIFEDKHLQLQGNSKDDIRDYQIANLNRRVENLEEIVLALLRDRVPHDLVEGYRKSLDFPTFTPSSSYLKDHGKRIVSSLDRWPKENLDWPEKPESSK